MKSYAVGIAVFITVALLSAPAIAQKDIGGRYAFAQFSADSMHTMVEFYYQIPSGNLNFRPSAAGGQQATVRCSIRAEQTGIERSNEMWQCGVHRTGSSEPDHNVLGVHRVVLTPGEYRIHLEVSDSAVPDRRDTLVIPYRVHDYANRRLSLSSIQLGRTLRYAKPGEDSPFIKGGIEIMPNVEGAYADGSLSLVYYAEVYNVNTIPLQDSLFIETLIFDRDGVQAYHHLSSKPHTAAAIGVAESLSIDALTSGKYRLLLRAITAHTDGKKSDTIQNRTDFEVNNSSLPAFADPMDAPDVASSEFSGHTEGELDTLFLQFSPIASKQEKELFKTLQGANAKADFLFAFWDRRNREGGMYTLKTYHQAIDQANIAYKCMGKPGWHTDRGRVFLQYGTPSQSPEKHLFDTNTKPYEIWPYNIEGGVIFVFVDIGGFGDYRLVHSTARVELHDENWMRFASGLMKGQ